MAEPIGQITRACAGCDTCREACAFLKEYGNPGEIAKGVENLPDTWMDRAFECSLCGLCSAICPKGLDVPAMFLALRRRAVTAGRVDLSRYRRILGYEKRGNSRRFRFYGIPKNCDTIFFPGCTLPGTRPRTTLDTIRFLRRQIPGIGVVLDCCAKPSHDLGRQDYFKPVFGRLTQCLRAAGVTRVITACSSCHKVFRTHAPEFRVETVYEVLAGQYPSGRAGAGRGVTVHDACQTRFEPRVHTAVRRLLTGCGLEVTEAEHSGARALCCGEGGAVARAAPKFSSGWTQKRVRESDGLPIAAYCAGCTSFLSGQAPSFHVLDLVFDPQRTLAGRARVSRSPFTYVNRFRLKQQLKMRIYPGSVLQTKFK